MDNKHQLTERLKVIETEIYNKKVELKGIQLKLNNADAYETELNERLVTAKKNAELMRKEFFIKASEISAEYSNMKEIFDVFTVSFFKDIK